MMDNNPLTYVLTSAMLHATGHRWLAALSNFNFSIQYKAGKHNADADGLSRRPHDPAETNQSAQVEDDRVRQFISKFVHKGDELSFPTETFKAICQRHKLHGCPRGQQLICHSRVSCHCLRQQEDREVQRMLRVFDQLVLDNDVLYRKRMNQGEPFFQLVLLGQDIGPCPHTFLLAKNVYGC